MAIKQAEGCAPSTAAPGENVTVTVETNWPAADTTPANITVFWSSECGDVASAINQAIAITPLVGSSAEIGVTVPSTLTPGAYNVQLTNSAPGDVNFVTANCSEIIIE